LLNGVADLPIRMMDSIKLLLVARIPVSAPAVIIIVRISTMTLAILVIAARNSTERQSSRTAHSSCFPEQRLWSCNHPMTKVAASVLAALV
jgi:hypothetical protein